MLNLIDLFICKSCSNLNHRVSTKSQTEFCDGRGTRKKRLHWSRAQIVILNFKLSEALIPLHYRTRPSMQQLTHSLIQIIWGPYPATVISLTPFLKAIVLRKLKRYGILIYTWILHCICNCALYCATCSLNITLMLLLWIFLWLGPHSAA